MTAEERTPDASVGLIDRAPAPVRPYLRLMRADRPAGAWLLYWPCLWGALIARPETMGAEAFWRLVVLFGIGAFVMRSAGCVYNDVVDRDLDAQVARTASRPIASGRVSVKAGWALLVGLSLIGLLVLVQLPLPAILAGVLSLGLVAAYPFMKRVTWWPQAWLGLTFNWGVVVGSAAVAGAVTLPALLTYAAGLFWTLGYDTIYACQDIEDDALAGVKSSARRLGTQAKGGVAGFYAASTAFLAAALFVAGAGPWTALALLPGAQLAWQAVRFAPPDGPLCLSLFKSNVWTGALVTVACLAG
ncbi:4-hydroxybenzoate octaprenyltransferase [Parvularcula dongshanensis]|uniref:4-hydroxybenzoate octaprenyltransferase n=1 Tax=Parvularcula dongshanensis TaxID=1173995 RepID=A0A840I0Z0_9PROT|nr:4-hydroxybenzoate polyprenyltransferase [Parvularcula dongshanensis]